jgi:hypothetical protein
MIRVCVPCGRSECEGVVGVVAVMSWVSIGVAARSARGGHSS